MYERMIILIISDQMKRSMTSVFGSLYIISMIKFEYENIFPQPRHKYMTSVSCFGPR